MLEPINGAQLPSQHEILSIVNKREALFLESSITSIKKQPIEYQKRILEISNRIWSFIKIYFLFLCFNADDISREKRHSQLSAYIKLFYQAAKDRDTQTETIVREFGNLSKTVQEDVKQAIENIYKLAYPNKSSDFYKSAVQQQLKAPFDVINKGQGEREIQVYGKALLCVQNKYAGFEDKKDK